MKQIILFCLLFACFTASAQELTPFKDAGGKYGFKDESGKIIVQPKYETVYPFSEGLSRVKQNGKWGYIDKTGKIVVELKYDDTGGFSEGLSRVKQNGKWGLVDKTGKEIVTPKYENIERFSEGLAAVKQNGKWGCIDKTGKELIKLQYEYAVFFEGGKAVVTLNGRQFYIDKTGKEIATFTTLSPAFYEQFKAILMAKEVPGTGKVLSKDNSGWTHYSSAYKLDGFTVEERISESYGAVTADAEANTKKIDPNVVVRKELSNYTLTDQTWNEWMVREISFELKKLKAEGFSVTTDNNIFRIGEITVRKKDNNRDVAKLFLNKDNSIEIIFPNKKVGANANTNQQATNTQTKTPLKYKSGTIYEGEVVNNVPNGKGKMTFTSGTVYEGDFVNGQYEGKGKYIFNNGDIYEGGFVNGKRSGKGKLTYTSGKVKEGDWENDKFINGEKKTTLQPFSTDNGKYGFKDESGKIIIEPKYDLAWNFSEGLAMVVLKKKYGFIDETGNEAIPLKYNYADFSFQNGKVQVQQNGRYFYIDKTGKEVK